MIEVYEIDEQGFLKNVHLSEDENTEYITVKPENGFYKPKWTGTEWIEGKTQAEFEEDKKLEALQPTQEQLENAELEIKVLTLLTEMGIV